MIEARAFSASVVLNKSSLWVTGGIGQYYLPLNSTELVDITLQKSVQSSIRLPINLHLHCLIKINDKQVLLVGGLGFDGPQAKTYLFDFDTMTWFPGVDLLRARFGHSCGMIKRGESATAVVVGGSNPYLNYVENSVEMLDLELGTQWKYGMFFSQYLKLH